MAERRKASPAHPAKAIYVRITLPGPVRQERCCTSNYLIREAATPRGRGAGAVGVVKGGEGGKAGYGDWVKPTGPAAAPGHSHYCCN